MGIEHRSFRTQYAVEKMGGTILAAAMTTGGCGMPMLLCTMAFFNKMATMIVLTIVLSFIFTLGFFVSGMITCGPSGDQGDLPCCVKKNKEASAEPEVGPPIGATAAAEASAVDAQPQESASKSAVAGEGKNGNSSSTEASSGAETSGSGSAKASTGDSENKNEQNESEKKEKPKASPKPNPKPKVLPSSSMKE